MNFDSVRRPIRVSLTPPTEPATPPNPSIQRDRDWRAQQVRMAALHATALIFPTGAWPLGTPILSVAEQFEHYILTGETEESQS